MVLIYSNSSLPISRRWRMFRFGISCQLPMFGHHLSNNSESNTELVIRSVTDEAMSSEKVAPMALVSVFLNLNLCAKFANNTHHILIILK